MKKIVAPIDFSPASRNAAEYAALLAKACNGQLHLLHVYKDLMPVTVGPEPWTVTASGLQSQYEAQMDKEIQFLEGKYSVKVSGEVKRGSKSQSIDSISKDMAAELIVLGAKSVSKSKIAGSTSLKVIRKTNIPVLMVPAGVPFSPIKNIVLAVNFNEITAGPCLDPLFQIVRTFDASLRVLHVERRGADLDPADMPGKLQVGRDLSKVSYLYDKIEYNDVDQGILQFVQSHPADMLVMIAQQHNVFEQLFGTIHTRSVSRLIKLPLLILKNSAY
jgi:nucleotide-binding universal stress UspA family protein